MDDVRSSSTGERLRHLHTMLAKHFAELHAARQDLDPGSPVFALEHALSVNDLDLLKTTVRAAVREGLAARHRLYWLPFIVYAAESGYDYVGGEYWRSFEEFTPGWRDDHRNWIKTWFQRFASNTVGPCRLAHSRQISLLSLGRSHMPCSQHTCSAISHSCCSNSAVRSHRISWTTQRHSVFVWLVERQATLSASASSVRTRRL